VNHGEETLDQEDYEDADSEIFYADSVANFSESDHSELDDLEADFSFMAEEESDDEETEKTVDDIAKDQMADWGLSEKRGQLTKLLHIIHPYMPFLPLDSKTLLKSMRKVVTVEVPPGRYYHFGIKHRLSLILDRLASVVPIQEVAIYFSFDGLPLTKSTKKKFIPITAMLVRKK